MMRVCFGGGGCNSGAAAVQGDSVVRVEQWQRGAAQHRRTGSGSRLWRLLFVLLPTMNLNKANNTCTVHT